jgi:hypothetical protein
MRKAKTPKNPRPKAGFSSKRTRLLALEPRMMFDGALAADVAAAAAHPDATRAPVETTAPIAEKPANERLAETAAAAPKIVVFVDYRVADQDQLLAGINPAATVVKIGPAEDGAKKIADTLAQFQNVTSVQIVSHGGPGFLELGITKLDQQLLNGDSAGVIAGWREALAPGADVLLLGCDVAVGTEGAQFMQSLAAATGADVAASTGLTGAAARGGNWVLEAATGRIDSGLALADSAMNAYAGLLAAPTITDAGGSRTTAEDNSIAITGVTIADADAGNSQTVTITATNGSITLAGTSGLTGLTSNGTASISFVASDVNATAAMNGMTFTPTQDFSGTATFAVSTNDGTSTVNLGTRNITVTPNANAPVLTLPATAQTLPEDVATYLNFTGSNAIVLTDADANDLQTLTLSAAHGTLLVKTNVTGGITNASGNGTRRRSPKHWRSTCRPDQSV